MMGINLKSSQTMRFTTELEVTDKSLVFIEFLSHKPNKLQKISVDPDQLASQNPADLDLQCFQNGIFTFPLQVFK